MATKTTFKLISANDFIKAHPSGEPNLQESKKVLVDLAAIEQPARDYDILIDVRAAGMQRPLTYSELYELVAELCRHREAFRNKIAILTRTDSQFDRASFYEEFARARGFEVGAFTDFEQAIDWLSETAEVTPAQNLGKSAHENKNNL